MATPMIEFIRQLRSTVLRQDAAGLSDAQILGRFIEQRDESALAVLVRRHGPMVWGVCRRILAHHHDAEDAFQATFLVLVRRASAIAPREMVGNWLYGVAYQTALKARAMAAKRRTRERQVTALPEIGVEPHGLCRDLHEVLDHELSRLPDKYRAAIVLCHLEGKTRVEAARQLGVPPGTLAARLTRGRELLAKRLTRQGLAVSGGTLAAVLSEQAASACRPVSVMSATIKAITSVSAGQAPSLGATSSQAAALTEGMVKTMLLTKVKIATGVVLLLTVSAASGLLYKTNAAGPATEAPRVEQKRPDDVRAAALKALEQLGKSDQASDREAAIKALAEYRRELRAAEEARQNHAANAGRYLADRFRFRIPIKLGETEFHGGGRLEIREVWGTRPRIEVGGQYLVRGKYVLPSHDHGKLHFWLTSSNPHNSGPDLDLQHAEAHKGEGTFTLLHDMRWEGEFHIRLYGDDYKPVANVYFGNAEKPSPRKP